jgi:phenylpropionate dioxygenase-like ring-hydroxylating dioxygenase large terminal subunit
MATIPSAAVPVGAVRPVRSGPGDGPGGDFVVWRGRDGRLRTAPRWCPHLDHDLAEGFVRGDELVCAGHGWAFDGDGHAYKRTEHGRVDPKGAVPVLPIAESGDTIEVGRP